MSDALDVIYLEPNCAHSERCWCSDDNGPCDECGKPWVRYVRADAQKQLTDQRDELLAVCKKIRAQGTLSSEWFDDLEAAIARAEGGA
jgi:hypothetical protein